MKKTTTLLVGLISVLFATSASTQVTQEPSRNYQINETHTGSTSVYDLAPPLKQKWSVNFGQSMSYPLIAGGKVFVTVRNPSAYGTQLYALNGVDGTTAWSYPLGGVYYWSGLCYENGRVFAVNVDGLLRAFDAATGAVIWTRQLPGQYMFSAPPTVFQGVVYVSGAGSGGTVYAVLAASGTVWWTASVANGDKSSPAVTTDGVYVSYSCPNVYKLNPTTGAQIWRYNPGCSGGGGKTAVLYNGRLYVRDSSNNYIFDSQTGGIAGSFLANNPPVFNGDLGFFMKNTGSFGTVEARDVNTNLPVWSFAGDNFLQSSMLVVNNYLYVGSDKGKLYAIDAASGQQVWSTTAGTSIPYVDEWNVSQPLTGFAAGDGMLVVPTKTTLVAYVADHSPSITWDNPTPAANSFGWNNTPVQLSFTAFAHPAGNTFSTPGSPIQFNSEGNNQTQQVTVSDEAGHTATITSPIVKIDWTAPVTSKTLSGTVATSGPPGWYSSIVQVSLSAVDSLSGLKNIFYSVDGGSTQTYWGPFWISTDGAHTLNYWSTDIAGNTDTAQSVAVNIDASGPSTLATVTSANSYNGWYSDPAQVSLSASDDHSGVANTFYTVDGGPAQTYTDPFSVAGEANHVISYWSVNTLGKAESPHSLTVKIDASAPSTSLSVSGISAENGWYKGPSVQVSLTAADSRSGVAATYYSLNGGAAQTYAGAFTLNASAVYQVSVWSVDKVGNTEAQHSFDVKIDNEGPRTTNEVSSSGGGGNYFKGPVQMSLTATDNVSGVASTYYQIDGGPTQTYAAPFAISGDGTHPVHFWSVDVAGNNTYSYTVNINIDGTAPSTQAALSGTAGGNGWYSTPVQVTLNATDSTSGVAATWYTIDYGSAQAYSGPFTISTTGTHTLVYWSLDQANNVETQQSMTVKVDVSAPSTQASVYGSSFGEWYQSPAQVGFTTSDGASGVTNTYYTVDGGATQTYSGLFNASAGGVHTINYWSVDAAGNSEHQQSLTVKVDNTAPTTQFSPVGTVGTNGWYRSAVQVSLIGSDSQAGVNVTLYRVDGGLTQVYGGPFAVSGDGQHTVSYWSNDKVSNTEANQTATIKIDSTVPTTQSSVSGPAGGNGYYKGAVQFSLTASDNLSGVANKYFRIDGGATQTYSALFAVSGDGNHAVDFWSVDVAGNVGAVSTVMIKIDTTAPLTQTSVSGSAGTNGWYLGAVQVSLIASDNLSGVQTTSYKVDGGTTKAYVGAFSVSGNGAHTVNFWSVDKATNTESTRTLTISIDTNLPNVTASVTPASANKSSNPVTITVSGKVTDTTSGVFQSGSATFNVVDEYGITQPSGPVTLQTNGNYSFTLSLPATRNAGDNQHVYTIYVRGTDKAGNTSSASDTLKIN